MIFPSDWKLHPWRHPDQVYWQLRSRRWEPASPAIRAGGQGARLQRHLHHTRQQVGAAPLSLTLFNSSISCCCYISLESKYEVFFSKLYFEWNSLTISDISRTFSQTGFLVKLYKKIFQNRLGNLESFVKYTFVHSVYPGGAGQKEDARVAAGLPHHRPLRHRLLDLLHRPAWGGPR